MRNYLDVLTGTFMIRQLQPWFENIKKRQVKSPKVYFRDSGILHILLGTNNKEAISRHPKLGASWEGFAMESVIRKHKIPAEECFFWAIHQQAEVDLLLILDGKKIGFEFKWADAPKLSKSMLIAMETLQLEKCYIIYPGKKHFQLSENIFAVGLEEYIKSQNSI